MAGKKSSLVPRPPKKTEYEIRFATTQAQKGWTDLVATVRNAMAETWDFLTRTPQDGRTGKRLGACGEFGQFVVIGLGTHMHTDPAAAEIRYAAVKQRRPANGSP